MKNYLEEHFLILFKSVMIYSFFKVICSVEMITIYTNKMIMKIWMYL